MKKYAVVIPIYRAQMYPIEKFSFDNNIQKLQQYDIYAIMPESLDFPHLHVKEYFKLIRFDNCFFRDYHTYSQLLMSEEFYQAFNVYEKILICQLDAYVFEDRMEYFCSLPYDYIGAPAFLHYYADGTCDICPGNGGFSLRDVQNTLRLLKHHSNERDTWNSTEDAFFSFCAMKYPDEFCMPSASVAASFAFDRFVSTMYKWTNQKLPFGIHAWSTYASQFVCQFLTKEQNRLLDGFLKKITAEEILQPFYNFLSRNSTIVLYGAGVWGTFVARAMQILHVNIDCFVISNRHTSTEQQILGIPVYCISEIDSFKGKMGVIISFEQRYMTLEEKKNIQKIYQEIKKRGAEEILNIDSQLFSFIAEIVLKKEGRGFS